MGPGADGGASIGQVHRAVAHDGLALAVKVQYPGVERAIRSDLSNAGFLFGMLGRMFPGIEPGPIVEEIRARLLEELDYEVEADNQRLFANYYARHPFISVPRVVDRYSTARVLATELAEGARFEDMERWSQAERDLAAEAIFRFVFGSIHRMHAFNGDPHPGNYLFRPGGRVSFLDFGLVKRFTDAEIATLQGMAKAMAVDRDVAEFRAIIERAGFIPPGQPFSNQLVSDYFGHFFTFLVDDGPMTFTPEYASETVRRLFETSGPYAEIMTAGNAPPRSPSSSSASTSGCSPSSAGCGPRPTGGRSQVTCGPSWAGPRRRSSAAWRRTGGPPPAGERPVAGESDAGRCLPAERVAEHEVRWRA